MATGDKLCPNCGQWQVHCRCGYAAARQTGSWINAAPPWTSGYMQRADAPPNPPSKTTTTAKPGDPLVWLDPTWTTTVTTKTYKHKPRKRRHYRQEVY